MEKEYPIHTNDTLHDSSSQVPEKWQGTQADQRDMAVIGRPQQLRRNFQLVTTLGFGCTLISTWEINIMTFGLSLPNGGTAGLIYGFLVCTVGYGLVYASLAELASMCIFHSIWACFMGSHM